jgi:ABC-type multidrug transport system ATPase subunit
MTTITFDDVVKRYGDVVALDGIDLSIETDRCHCLLGANGSGKTTLLSILLGLTRPGEGTVRRPEGTVGCSFQTPTFYPDLTVGENLDVFASMAPPPSEEWRTDLTALLELDRVAHRPAGDLSGGWQKKLDLCLAFLKRPTFAVLDEPLDDLDDRSKRRFRDFLASYSDDDHGLLIATHHVEAFEDSLDRLTVLDRGRIRYDGPIDDGPAAKDRYLELVGD